MSTLTSPQVRKMEREDESRWRWMGTTSILLAELAHLAWEHFHGGISRHHILNRVDRPAISNGWGILLLPTLTWFLTGRILNRPEFLTDGPRSTDGRRVIAAFAGSILYGALLSGGFSFGYTTLTEVLFQGLVGLALFLPIHRSECVLGFILGMTFVFGAILPTGIASILAAFSWLIHRTLHRGLAHLWGSLKRRLSGLS